MNCIDCMWSIQENEEKQCKRANPNIRECVWYKKIKREVTKVNE